MQTKQADQQLEETVIEVIAETLSIDAGQVTREAAFFTDLPMDSLDMVEILMNLEEALHLDIPDDDTEGMRTVGDAVDYIAGHV